MTISISVERVDFCNSQHGKDLIELLDEYARDPAGGGIALSEWTRANLFSELGKREGCHAFIAYRQKQPVGLLISFEGFSTFACKPLLNLHDIVVSEPYRGMGSSKRLMEKAESTARERGCCKLTLEVLSNNSIALAAYKKFGFEQYTLSEEFGCAQFWQKKLL